MKSIINVKGLSKRYEIKALQKSDATLSGALGNTLSLPVRRLRSNGNDKSIIWALRDVSFEVKPGEIFGVIGRNGAGKSTLLKILSRITEPTSGRAELYGRVGSLLEVGTGFHPELTGRENVYLNGSILGMKRAEIARKFDEIVAFAEIERFLDVPVKRYSSGMHMRLAFAVAAHLEPEILMIDEVLAVGDANFQKKCLGKMDEVARGGRTVIFVTHNLASMAALCGRAIILSEGRKISEGPTVDVINEYLGLFTRPAGECVWPNPHDAPGNEKIRIRAVRIISDGKVTGDVQIQNEVHVEVEYWNLRPGTRIMTSVHLLDKMKTGVLSSANMHSANLLRDEWFNAPHPIGLYRASCTIPGKFLNEGNYYINALVLSDVSNVEARVDEAVSFTVHDSGATPREFVGYWLGVVRPSLAWQTERLNEGGEPSVTGSV